MNANDIIAHYAMERLELLLRLEHAEKRAAELQEKLDAKEKTNVD